MLSIDSPTSPGLANNPFRTFSNFIYPKTMFEAIRWALWFWERSHKYRTSLNKVVSYFLSSLSITQEDPGDDGVDTDLVENFENLLTDTYEMMPLALNFGVELAALGNVFVSAETLFSRMLVCPSNCGWAMALDKLTPGREYKWEDFQFKGICPKCKRHVVYNIKDTPTTNKDGCKIRFIFRNIYDMNLSYNQLTGDYEYLYKIPQHIRSAIAKGDPVYLKNTPKVFFEACRKKSYISFPPDRFFSMRTKTLSALDTLYKGWGAPLFLASFDNLVNFQNLNKFNEAITRDYINPVRIISPQPQNLTAGVDVNRSAPLAGHMFRSFLQDSLARAKDNPTTWIISPVPVQYQLLGGEAKQLAPVELMEWHETQILSDMGIPQEFRQSSFQVVAPSMGLRMFERQWIHFARGINKFVRWAADQISNAHKIEQMTCALDMTSFIEDDMNKQVLLQWMSAGLISKSKVLKRFGVDFNEDLKERIREAEQENELQQAQQMQMQNAEMVNSVLPPAGSIGIGQAQGNIQAMQAAAQGQPAGPESPAAPAMPVGAPPTGGGSGLPFNEGASQSASIEDLYAQSQQIANDLYQAPHPVRVRELDNLKKTNPVLHAAVKQALTDMEQQVASEAVAQSKQVQ